MGYNFINQNVLATIAINARNNDPFFNPEALGLTGYAYNGFYYTLGVQSSTQASWFTEGEGLFRGSSAPFPQSSVVILSDVALSIVDQDQSLDLWMTFLIQDNYALPNNYNYTAQGFKPSGLEYACGRIVVNYTPDPGSQSPNVMSVTLDFVNDYTSIYRPLTYAQGALVFNDIVTGVTYLVTMDDGTMEYAPMTPNGVGVTSLPIIDNVTGTTYSIFMSSGTLEYSPIAENLSAPTEYFLTDTVTSQVWTLTMSSGVLDYN
jgi:hypothetical protein